MVAKSLIPRLCVSNAWACLSSTSTKSLRLSSVKAMSTRASSGTRGHDKPRYMQTQTASTLFNDIGAIQHRARYLKESKVAFDGSGAHSHAEALQKSFQKSQEFRSSGPYVTAQELLAKASGGCFGSSLRVLDAGCCDTGLVGLELQWQAQQKGCTVEVQGCDISHGAGHMNQPLSYDSNTFDGVACSGVLLRGNVKLDLALPELCRVVKPGGCVVATVSSDYSNDSLEEVIATLKTEGHSVECKDFQYLKGISAKLLTVIKSAS